MLVFLTQSLLATVGKAGSTFYL